MERHEKQDEIPYGYITTKTASKRYGFHTVSLANLASAGLLTAVKVTDPLSTKGRWYIDPLSIETYRARPGRHNDKSSRKKSIVKVKTPVTQPAEKSEKVEKTAKHLKSKMKKKYKPRRQKTMWERILYVLKG